MKNINTNICKPMAWVEIDTQALKKNFRAIKKYVGAHIKIIAVIKADAYGHGIKTAAKVLCAQGVDMLGVSDLNEGIGLRQLGITKPILMMESALSAQAKHLIDWRITPTVCTLDLAQALDRLARARRQKICIHIKVDTGMGRLGVALKQAPGFIRDVQALKNLKIQGLLTHFPVADIDSTFTRRQIQAILSLAQQIKQQGISLELIHAANSMGLSVYPLKGFQAVRAGIMLYGLYPHPNLSKKIKLKPVMSVKARICFIKEIEKGQGISYGHCFIAPKPMTVATVSIGYSDGYFRIFSNKAFVLVNGQRCPVIGTVTMDQIIVDVSRVKSVCVGDEVCLLGQQANARVSADELAKLANTIHYEITCSLGSRLERVLLK